MFKVIFYIDCGFTYEVVFSGTEAECNKYVNDNHALVGDDDFEMGFMVEPI